MSQKSNQNKVTHKLPQKKADFLNPNETSVNGSSNSLAVQQISFKPLDLIYFDRGSSIEQLHDHRQALKKYIEPADSSFVRRHLEAERPLEDLLVPISSADGIIGGLSALFPADSVTSQTSIISNPPHPHLEQTQDDLRLKMTKNNSLRPKVLICVCMYNEGKGALIHTLNGIYSNLSHLKQAGYKEKDIIVVVLQDGILKLVENRDKRTYVRGEQSLVHFYADLDKADRKPYCALKRRINAILDHIDWFKKNNLPEQVINNQDFPPSIPKNCFLLYQNLWKPSTLPVSSEPGPASKYKQTSIEDSLAVFTCFKHTNGTKLSSHQLFFEGFCRYLQPEYCVLLDVGTKPDPRGILNFLTALESDSQIGGCAGLLTVDSNLESHEGGTHQADNWSSKLLDSLTAGAQESEYLISHFLDKNAESLLGFLHVLPGAWSAYRYDTLAGSGRLEKNLLEDKYLRTMQDQQFKKSMTMEMANMYLAEDRILSMGIYCKKNSNYVLRYVPDAVARTDPMSNLSDLIIQRRRWINSSLFAFKFVWEQYSYELEDSNHGFLQRFILIKLNMVLAATGFINTYFTPAVYAFTIFTTIRQISKGSEVLEALATVMTFLYIMVFVSSIFGSLSGRLWTKRAHYAANALNLFSLTMFLLVITNVGLILQRVLANPQTRTPLETFTFLSIILNLGLTFLLLFLHSCTHFDMVKQIPLRMIHSLLYNAAYSQVMVVHAFCNVDDVSWGTKGSVGSRDKQFLTNKLAFLSQWQYMPYILRLGLNCLIGFLLIYFEVIVVGVSDTATSSSTVLLALGCYGLAVLAIKSILAVLNHCKWILSKMCCSPSPMDLNPTKSLSLIEECSRASINICNKPNDWESFSLSLKKRLAEI